MYQLSYIKYCQFILLTFIAGLLWGDRVVDCGSYARQWHTSSTSLSSWSHKSWDTEMEERLRHQDELINNLMQSQQYIISMIQILILKYAICPISNIA
jgi:hypothetical protein